MNMTEYKVNKELTFITNKGISITLQPGSIFKSPSLVQIEGIEEISFKPVFETHNPWWFNDYNILDAWKMGYTGKGVKVAVLDSGIYLKNGEPHKDLDLNPMNLKSIAISSEGMNDTRGHGLHISGIIKASNNGTGITGIAYDCDFYFAKVVNNFSTLYESYEYLIEGIKWAVNKKVDIINISRGYDENTTNIDFNKLEEVINEAVNNNIIIVCAAGNKTKVSGNNLYYPARYNHTISVGGVKRDKTRLESTIAQEDVDIYAPGESIYSTSTADNGYAINSGSSQACAYITGVLALALQKIKERNGVFNNEIVKNILIETSDNKRIINPINLLNHI
jgi:minor extracellular protease Epr